MIVVVASAQPRPTMVEELVGADIGVAATIEDTEEIMAALRVEGPCDAFESSNDVSMVVRQVHYRVCHQLRGEITMLKEEAAKMKAKVEMLIGAAALVLVLESNNDKLNAILAKKEAEILEAMGA